MKTLFTFFLLVSFIHAGDADRFSPSTLLFLQGLNIDSYQSLGFSNMFTSSAIDLSSGNPAILNTIDQVSVGVNLDYKTKIKDVLLSSIDIEQVNQFFPGSIAFVFPLNGYNLAFSYHQKYYDYIYLGKFPITTIENPDGTGEFFEADREIKINSISGIISSGLSHILKVDDYLNFGLQIYYDMYSSLEKIYHTKGSVSENDINWKLGVNYSLNDNLQLGLMYESGFDITHVYKISGLQPADTNSVNYASTVKDRIKLPDKMVFGAQISTSQKFSLSTTLSYVFWKSVYKSYENNLDISVTAIYSLFDFVDISLGIYQTDLRFKNSNASNNGANFLGAGVKFELYDLTAQLVVLDSHVSSSKSREQTIVNLGLGYSFH